MTTSPLRIGSRSTTAPPLKKPAWMVGDHPGADFLNTVDARGYPNEIDHLADYDDFLRWIGRASLMKEAELRRLKSLAASASAGGVLAEAKRLREAAHRVVLSRTKGKDVARRDLSVIGAAFEDADRARPLTWTRAGFARSWRKAIDARRPYHAIAFALQDLLAPANLDRVHVCEGDACDWAFLDTSPSQRRRWCHMSACGNRAKVRKLRARQRRAKA